MKTVVIRESEWGIGSLCDTFYKKYCVVGHCLKSIGVSDEELKTLTIYSQNKDRTRELLQEHFPFLLATPSSLGEVVDTNDSRYMSLSEKKEKLSQLFAQNGVILEFLDS